MSNRGLAEEVGSAAAYAARWAGRLVRGHYVAAVGGPARARVIMLFACVLALSSADASTIGAVAPQLESALHITNAEVGLLSSATLLVGAVFVIPFGIFVDRAKRVPLLYVSIVCWSIASLVSAFAGSYWTLLLTRLLMGAVTATAGPAIASLTGDYFPSRERGRIYAYILGGELAGTAAGFAISGAIASLIDWRAAFVLLSLPGFLLARSLYKTLPEPQRGGQSRLPRGATDFDDHGGGEWTWEDGHEDAEADNIAHAAVRRRGVRADDGRVLHEPATQLGIGPAVRYILAVPTNLLLIFSSALGYFFLSGLTTFLVVFVRGHYHASYPVTMLSILLLVIAGVIGTLISGRVTDALVQRGWVEARMWVPAICYLAATVLFIPGILGTSLTPALWFDIAGATLLSAANPPLDAARLDIMPAGLWGRAESTRTVIRSLAQAVAPVLFGALADLIAGIVPEQVPIGTHPSHSSVVSASTATGLEYCFLVMLVALGAAGVFMARAHRTYPIDVATAAASQELQRPRGGAAAA
jgi:MFS family permease